MRFSSRLPWDAPTNPLLAALAAKRADGQTILDLTETNPTRAFNLSAFLQPIFLAQPEASVYNPSPRGLPSARAAIADYYRSHGHMVDPETLFLTASTSEAYSYLFKLLCNPGDEILAPQPSYPLLDFLTGLDSVTPVYYRLRYDDTTGWRINFDYLHQVISHLTRAIVVVNPNNPTGSYLHSTDLKALNALCTQHNLALIVDEVFLDYGDASAKTVVGNTGAPTFVLSGLSKIVAAPQIKLGWIQVSGRNEDIQQSIAHLDFIADTYLSASTPAQLTAPALLDQRTVIQQTIIERLQRNEAWLRAQPAPHCRILPRDGGWCLILEFNDTLSDDERALQLLERHNVFIHPGYFYDFAREGYVVLSLLTPEDIFQAGVAKLLGLSE
jgi:alanine-synthesizing transaminase